MKLEFHDDVLRVSAVSQLGAANAHAFRDWVRKNLAPAHKAIEIDLAETTFLDSSGLGALVALHKSVSSRGGTLRLLNAQPAVLQLLDLTRLNDIFEVVNC